MYLGIDIGTSGVRACAIDGAGSIVAEATEPMRAVPLDGGVDATVWLHATEAALAKLPAAVRAEVRGIAVDGTSGSMVLTDEGGTPVTPGLMYNSGGFRAEAERIAAVAPEGSIVRGEGSALARSMRLSSWIDGSAHLAHQADLIVAALTGRAGASDESNALKTGYDARTRTWPDFVTQCAGRVRLPDVRPVGGPLGRAEGPLARRVGLPATASIFAGATDSVAAFLAAGVRESGVAVTSLGTTLAIKVLSDRPVEDAARGIYSHRVGDAWLPGGASNTGGGVLLQHFSREALEAATRSIDPDWEPEHPKTYPLPRPGERFPRNDPALEPVLPPRHDEPRFLFELLHAIARIEREGYEALASLGAPYPSRVLTAGGGARNPVWTAIRARVLGVPVEAAANAEASYGMALLARDALTASGR